MIDNFQIVIYSGSEIYLASMFATLKINNQHFKTVYISFVLLEIIGIFVKGMNKLGNIFMYVVLNVTSWIGCQISEIMILLLKIIYTIWN